MSTNEQIQRSRLALRVHQLWGQKRTAANAAVVGSISQALARIDALQPAATTQLDSPKASDENDDQS